MSKLNFTKDSLGFYGCEEIEELNCDGKVINRRIRGSRNIRVLKLPEDILKNVNKFQYIKC